MKIKFITTNRHKFLEVSAVLRNYDIVAEQLDADYPEDKEKDVAEIALLSAKDLSEKRGEALIVEDTGLYFEAFNNFPGAQPKFVYESIGFKGIFKLLQGEDRSAYFKTVIAFCRPGEDPVSFEGRMEGHISEKVFSAEKDAMPYDHIFIPEGYDKAIVDMSMDEKNSFSQRAQAAKKLAEYLANNS